MRCSAKLELRTAARCARLVPLAIVLAAWLCGSAFALAPADGPARRVPGRPLVYVEARDFAGSLAALRASPQMGAWYATPSYQAFRNTKLAQKLEARFQSLEALLGAGVNTKNLETVAGGESGLAIYDIGKLEFLYATRLDVAKFALSALAPLKQKFDERKEGALTYFAKASEDGSLEFAFAQTADWLFASSHVDLLERALKLPPTGLPGDCLAADPRFTRLAAVEAGPADFRLFLDQARLNRDGYFRAYWLPRNVPELGWIDAGWLVASLGPGGVEERRVFLPASGAAPPTTAAIASSSLPSLATTGVLAWNAVAAPAASRVARALSEEILGAEGPDGPRELEQTLEGTAFEAMTSFVAAPVEREGHYLAIPRGLVLQAGSSPVTTAWMEPVRSWLSRALTGEPSHPKLAFERRGDLLALEIPFGAGRGVFVAARPGRLVVATHEPLALALAAAGSLPAGEAASIVSRRWVDLTAGRKALQTIVKRSMPATDPVRAYFTEHWGGLLDAFAKVDRVTDWSWFEAGNLRQVLRLEYGAAK